MKQGDEEEQQPKTLPMTEKPVNSAFLQRPNTIALPIIALPNISTIDEKRNYIELHKYLNSACKMLKLAVSTFSF